jgi:tetraacyldisaccharide 4'-kinase
MAAGRVNPNQSRSKGTTSQTPPGRRTVIGPPAFWGQNNLLSRAFSPLAAVVAAITARRIARPGWRAPVPVICCGNATVGGAGKTTLALDITRRLIARGIAVHVLLRGYRGSAREPRRVRVDDLVTVTGDEALLLAAIAPTWTGADRAASAKFAIEVGAEALVMDDGLQNPTLAKSTALLTIDGASGFGNGRVLPAGPLRELVANAAARCRAAVLIGADSSGALARLPGAFPVLRARLEQDEAAAALTGRRVLAFAGIAFPEKFFAGLERAGVAVADRQSFPDHHMFTPRELARLTERAKARDAVLVTTPKDAVRLPRGFDALVVGVRILWDDPAQIEALLDELMRGVAESTSPTGSVHGMTDA